MLAMLTSLSLGIFAACDEDDSQSTPSVVEDMCTTNRPHSYAWKLDDIGSVAKEVGQCTVCGEMAVLPALPQDQAFPTVSANANNDGYSPLDLEEGCYTLEIPASGEFWACFSAEQVGQFAFYSIGGTQSTVARYNAEIGFTCYFAIDGKRVDNNFYSYVNRSEEENGSNWRATFCVKGNAGNLVKVCFTRIASPIWVPDTVTTMVKPTEIKGKKADDAPSTKELVAVDYEENYYFDSNVGYYRTGTPQNPGEIIYAAITMKASRLFEDKSFIQSFEDFGGILYLNDGYTAEGNYNQLCYISFLYNCVDDNDHNNGETDPNKNCYMNFCNKDGVYPVTRELYQFLNLYIRQNRPISLMDDSEGYDLERTRDWREHKNENGKDENRNKYWLAACYYYNVIPTGTKDNPIALQEGNNELTVPAYERLYVTVPETGNYRLVCTDKNVTVLVNETLYTNGVNVVVKAGDLIRFDVGVNGGVTSVTLTKEN